MPALTSAALTSSMNPTGPQMKAVASVGTPSSFDDRRGEVPCAHAGCPVTAVELAAV